MQRVGGKLADWAEEAEEAQFSRFENLW